MDYTFINLAKSVAVGLSYSGDVWDFYLGKEIEKAVEIGVILTIISLGSESYPNAIEFCSARNQ